MEQDPIAAQKLPANIADEMRQSYMDYAMSVIIGRALPDVRDGLKPANRRVLYGMQQMGLQPGRPYRKCAKVAGEVMGNYHPHGEGAIYDTLVRLAQDWNMRAPLVDGQGNFGSGDGDNPGAMRYTEARLSRLGASMMADIEKETVDFIPTYDNSSVEPTVLPTGLPNLIVNGAEGIAVGMATKIPPHNLDEVVDALTFLLDNQDLTPDERLAGVMERIPGPDFPTAGFILGRHGIRQAYRTGRGSLVMRAKAEIEVRKGDRESIVITEIPYQVNKARLIEKIAELVREERIKGIQENGIRDESDRQGMRIVIDVKKGEPSQVLLNNLYKHTPLQDTFGVIFLAIVDLKDILASPRRVDTIVGDELKKIREEHGDARRTKIVDAVDEIAIEDLIADEDVAISITHSGYIKRTSISTYRAQKRGGRGRVGMRTRDEDFVSNLFIASTHSYILIFTDRGRIYWLKVHEIPDVGPQGKGKAVVNLVQLQPAEKIAAFCAVKEFAEGRFVLLATRNGIVKKTELSAFSNPRPSGIIALSVEDGDALIDAVLTSGQA